MKIAVFSKLSDVDAYYTISPLSKVSFVNQIYIFRNGNLKSFEKSYKVSYNDKFGKIFTQFFRLLSTIRINASVYIGVYEYPHGVVAYLASLIKKKKFVLNTISNPDYKKVRRGFRLWIFKYLLKKADAVAVTGEYSKNYMIRNYNLSPSKIFFIPNCIDVDDYPFVENKNIKYDIISLGRFDHEKKYPIFVEVVRVLKKTFPNIKVGMAGTGSDFDTIKNLIDKYKLTENIELLGFIDNPYEFYLTGRVFVSTSETEGMPRAAVQSMSCGVPCVTSNVGDMSDLIYDGINGYLIQPYDDVEQYVEKLIILLNNKSLYENMKNEAIKVVKKKFSIESSAKYWSKLLTYLEN